MIELCVGLVSVLKVCCVVLCYPDVSGDPCERESERGETEREETERERNRERESKEKQREKTVR